MDFSVQIVSHRPEMVAQVKTGLGDMPTHHFNGAGYPSFSKLVNEATLAAEHETVVIMGDKVRPTKDDVERLVSLVGHGFGLATGYRFGFFAFRKQLFREIGPFDERFLGGWFEDDDYMMRLREADIAFYQSEEVPYVAMPSAWDNEGNRERFLGKWGLDGLRLRDEEDYGYLWGSSQPTKWMSWKETVLMPPWWRLKHPGLIPAGARRAPSVDRELVAF